MGVELTYQIAITLVKGVGNATAKNLIAHLGSAEEVFKQTKSQLMRIPNIGEFVASQLVNNDVLPRAEKEVEFMLKNNISPIFYTDKDYPFRLKECADAPVMIYSKGNQQYNEGRYIGIVGTRKITEYGKSICQNLIKDLAQRHSDIVVVSGMAYGVDICAHKSALDNGLHTIGVFGHGLDQIYPEANRSTAIKAISQGALLTEYMSGTNPDRQNFVQRNRIIAGLSDALIVVESASKGGSLITAEIANSYNRDVFAFPGRVGDEYSLGCNTLIKTNKAALIECATDLENFMGWEQKQDKKWIQPTLFVDLSEQEKQIIALLRTDELLHINQLSLMIEMPMSKVSSLLIEMEFKGLLKCLPGNLYKLLNY